MLGSRLSARGWGQLAVALPSVLALLASACLPVSASAATVYEPESPTIPGETVSPGHDKAHNNPPGGRSATKSNSGGGAGGGDGESSRRDSSDGGAAAGKGNGPGKGQGNPGNGSHNGQQQPGNVGAESIGAEPVSAAGDDSSSPLVPILIAIAALAAVSVAAVVIRGRRQGGDFPQISPKAS